MVAARGRSRRSLGGVEPAEAPRLEVVVGRGERDASRGPFASRAASLAVSLRAFGMQLHVATWVPCGNGKGVKRGRQRASPLERD